MGPKQTTDCPSKKRADKNQEKIRCRDNLNNQDNQQESQKIQR